MAGCIIFVLGVACKAKVHNCRQESWIVRNINYSAIADLHCQGLCGGHAKERMSDYDDPPKTSSHIFGFGCLVIFVIASDIRVIR